MRKRIAAIALALVMVLACLPVTAGAGDYDDLASGTCGSNVTWRIDWMNALLIEGTGPMDDYTAGSAPWYPLRDKIEAIGIQDGVTSVGKWAFYGCDSARDFHGECTTLTRIGECAFYECAGLENGVYLSDEPCVIGERAFYHCANLGLIRGTLGAVGKEAFSGCSRLSSLSLGAHAVLGAGAFQNSGLERLSDVYPTVKLLSADVFRGCRIKNISFSGTPKQLKAILEESGCTDLDSATVWFTDYDPCENMTWKLEDGVLFIDGDGALNRAVTEPLREIRDQVVVIRLGEGIRALKDGAFQNFPYLTDVYLESAALVFEADAEHPCPFAGDHVVLHYPEDTEQDISVYFSEWGHQDLCGGACRLRAVKGEGYDCMTLPDLDLFAVPDRYMLVRDHLQNPHGIMPRTNRDIDITYAMETDDAGKPVAYTTTTISDQYQTVERINFDAEGYPDTVTRIYDGQEAQTEPYDDSEYYVDESGRLAVKVMPNGSWCEYDYDEQDRLVEERTYSGDGSEIESAHYMYDASGNVLSETFYLAGNETARRTYRYNESGDLTEKESFNNGSLFSTETYTYDGAGFLIAELRNYASGDRQRYSYAYDASGRLKGYTLEDYIGFYDDEYVYHVDFACAVQGGRMQVIASAAVEGAGGILLPLATESFDYVRLLPAFEDVSGQAYYSDAVEWALFQGITNGIGGNQFGPELTVVRKDAVTFLWRAMGCPEPTAQTSGFTDVEPGSFYEKPVIWAVENGITVGVGGNRFDPHAPLCQDQMLTFIYRTLGEPDQTGAEPWYADSESWARRTGLLDGTGKAYHHGDQCPRADVVYYLYRALAK